MLLSIFVNFCFKLNSSLLRLKAALRARPLLANERGQSLVEFVLLLTIVMILSLTFLKLVNGKVADYWLAMGKMLVEDPSVQLELK